MPTRVIAIFPEFEQTGWIEHLRDRFDPLASRVKGHITLVPPFESEITTSRLHDHIAQVTSSIQPFRLILQGITGHEEEYLFLNVKRGNDQLIELRDQLYTGSITPYFLPQHAFVPHLTVGRLPDKRTFHEALKVAVQVQLKFETNVTRLSAYSIHSDGTRPIDFSIALQE